MKLAINRYLKEARDHYLLLINRYFMQSREMVEGKPDYKREGGEETPPPPTKINKLLKCG